MAGAVSGVTRPEASVTARRSTIATRSRNCQRHVVEQLGLDADREDLVELRESINLNFDFSEMADADPRSFYRGPNPACDGDVVVLDQTLSGSADFRSVESQ
jgi:hypothetical protein